MQDIKQIGNGEMVNVGECPNTQIYSPIAGEIGEGLTLKEEKVEADTPPETRPGTTLYSEQEVLQRMYSSSRHDRRAFLKSFSKADQKRFRGLFEKYRNAKVENREVVFDEK